MQNNKKYRLALIVHGSDNVFDINGFYKNENFILLKNGKLIEEISDKDPSEEIHKLYLNNLGFSSSFSRPILHGVSINDEVDYLTVYYKTKIPGCQIISEEAKNNTFKWVKIGDINYHGNTKQDTGSSLEDIRLYNIDLQQIFQ